MPNLLCSRGFVRRSTAVLLVIALTVIALGRSVPARAGDLELLREDVRDDTDHDAWPEPRRSPDEYQNRDERKKALEDADDDNPWSEFVGGAVVAVGGVVVASPFWFPRNLLNDQGGEAYFLPYPYRDGSRYMTVDGWDGNVYGWAARLRTDYAENFDDLSRVGGHLLLSTTSRFGLDAETNYLQERFAHGGHDQLWLGDFNIIYRFAQSERAQWRAGLGFNWLDDPVDTDFGFNFTYGFDIYPRKPFVFSTELDWGTLGGAEAFHFRTTAGALIRGLETFVGYEYRDIDRFHFNGLVAGVRLWF
ncbi:MAG: hypothetical protein JW719_14220 [Pirellulales bacterium]|nr:hypothetical protein [Pirellulales bacterium]